MIPSISISGYYNGGTGGKLESEKKLRIGLKLAGTAA